MTIEERKADMLKRAQMINMSFDTPSISPTPKTVPKKKETVVPSKPTVPIASVSTSVPNSADSSSLLQEIERLRTENKILTQQLQTSIRQSERYRDLAADLMEITKQIEGTAKTIQKKRNAIEKENTRKERIRKKEERLAQQREKRARIEREFREKWNIGKQEWKNLSKKEKIAYIYKNGMATEAFKRATDSMYNPQEYATELTEFDYDSRKWSTPKAFLNNISKTVIEKDEREADETINKVLQQTNNDWAAARDYLQKNVSINVMERFDKRWRAVKRYKP